MIEAPDLEAELMQRAAIGDRAAQTMLRDLCAMQAYEGVTPFELLCMSEGFGRVVAAHGDPDDAMWLAGILWCRATHVAELGDPRRAALLTLQAEALCDEHPSLKLSNGVEYLAGVLSSYADAGNQVAMERLGRLADALSSSDAYALSERVKEISREMEAATAHG